jgi:signal peptidase I
MNFDFATILVLATVVTGGIWAADTLLWAPKRRVAGAAGEGSADGVLGQLPREPILVEYAKAFFPVILIVLLLRSFLVEPFRIPSGSMMPTLLDGDFILVNKFGYGIRLPVANKLIIQIDKPKRGDVVVFRFPRDPSVDYIKRVVGLPGDRISYRDKVVYVNGQPMKQELNGTYVGQGTALSMTGASLRKETLGNVEHPILTRNEQPPRDGEFVVPDGHYFVMGDNRDNSNDSRFWGFVPDENLVGRAFMIWMNWDSADNTVRWSRIGTIIE